MAGFAMCRSSIPLPWLLLWFSPRLTTGGRRSSCSSGAVPPFDPIRLSTSGSLFVTRPTLSDYIQSPVELSTRSSAVFGDLATGALRLPTVRQYSLRGAAQAHIDLEGRQTTGKLLLIP